MPEEKKLTKAQQNAADAELTAAEIAFEPGTFNDKNSGPVPPPKNPMSPPGPDLTDDAQKDNRPNQ